MAPTVNCYKLLKLDKGTATLSDVKKAYRKLALQFHPDKQPPTATAAEKKQANESFQNLGIAYAVLSDPKRKSKYDRTGSIEEGEFEGDKDWNAYFKELWTGVVNAETIESQKLKYQGSEEEEEDLLEAYKTYKGNMDKILEVVECSTAEDGERFAEIIKKAIKSKLVPSFKSFETTTTPQTHKKRIEKAKKAEIEFEKAEQKKKKGKAKAEKEEESDLLALIQARNKDRHANMNSIIESIEAEAKAKKGGKKRKQKEVDDMPSEEEFLKLQESLFNKKGKKSKK